MTPEQLGARIFVSGSQIRKVEAGTRAPAEDLVKACEAMGELGCNGALTELYEILGEKLKRRAYPGWFAAWPDKEAQAGRLRSFELVVVPGLLQTQAYARAVLSTRVGATPDEIDETVAARLARQQILEQAQPPELWAILDEGALRRPVGGQAVMRGQLNRLIEVSQMRHVTFQVVPFERGAHAAAGGSFTVLRFGETDVPDVVYIEQLTSALYLDKREDVDHYMEVMNHLSTEALTPAETVRFIEEIVKET